ncbi:MAG: hypothetical protein ACTTIO_04105 [Candidatus Fimenecus sp.]
MKRTIKIRRSIITVFILSIIIFATYIVNASTIKGGRQCITLTGDNVVDLGQDCYYIKVPIGTSGQLQYTLNEVDGIQPEGKAVFYNRKQNQNILTLSKDGKYTAKEYGKQRIDNYYINYSKKSEKLKPILKSKSVSPVGGWREIEIEVVDKNGNSIEEIPIYRLYNPKSGKYVFTRFMTEKDKLIKKGYKDEGTAWQMATDTGYIKAKEKFGENKKVETKHQNTKNPKKSLDTGRTYGVEQFENILTKDRVFTNVIDERNSLVQKKLWRMVEYNSYSKSEYETPVYRLYQKKGLKGAHYYTTDEKEKNQLVASGWKDEGIAFYAK